MSASSIRAAFALVFALAALACLRASVATADVRADLAALPGAGAACPAGRAHCIGIQVHVAGERDGLVVAPAWIVDQVVHANQLFAPLDVGFAIVGADALPASAVHVETRGARDAIAAGLLTGTVVHVFVIGKLENIDDPRVPVHGVTWRRPHEDRKYIILAADARSRTLAHELGHVFGLPHSTYAISIMNKTPRTEPPPDARRFADEEVAAMRPALARLLVDHTLADLGS